jgi:protein-S-isoprenylcysteine O-methyltransferase Ste14
VPPAAERSTYVLQATLLLALIVWQWQPLPATIWQVEGAGAWAFYALFAASLGLVQLSTFQIDHFELFGLKQAWHGARGTTMAEPEFRTPLLYRIVRHPMQLGAVTLFYATPHMTAGHLLMAAAMTAYVLVGLHFEERALIARFGRTYADYRAAVPMLVPRLWPRGEKRLAHGGRNA